MRVVHAISGITFALAAINAWAQEPVETELEAAVEAAVSAPTEVDLFARDSYKIDSLVCPFKGGIDYEPGEIECGLLQVPENRENPDSRMIELHFVKLSSRWGREGFERDPEDEGYEYTEGLEDGIRDDPVIYLTGGPGAPVTAYVSRFKDHTLLDHRDLYILEQRGIGASDNFCEFYGNRNPLHGDVENYEQYLEAARKYRADCARNAAAAGVDLAGYNTIENARDVKALRRALGFDKWNVWGISYGSILGQAYIKEDPEGILAVALDAIMPLDIQESDQYWRVINWYERDLQKLQEICQRQADCAETYPDIPGRVREAMQSVIDNPIVVDVKDTEAYPSGQARIFHDIAGLLPFIFFYEQSNYPGLPGVIYAWADMVESRDPDIFRTLAEAASDEGGLFSSAEGMRMAILCNDGDVQAQGNASRRDIEEYPILGQLFGDPANVERENALCVELGMPLRPKEQYAPTVTDIPTLIIEGDMDPITPPPNAKAILPGFSNGTYVEFPYAGHGPSRSVTCAGHLLNKFYDNPSAEPDLSCVEDMEEPQIWAPMYTTSIAPKLAARYLDDPKKLILPGAWGALSLVVCLLAFVRLTFAPIGRWIDGRRAPDTGAARGMAWLAATTALLALGIIGAAAAVTAQTSEMLVAFGLVPWASWGGYLAIVAVVLGLWSLWTTFSVKRRMSYPPTSMMGFMLTSLAAVGLGSFILVWGLGPF
ncbi:MAG: cysteine proteinase [Lysobacteraceae bacterium]|nr:MAG: cysteine proteinase [Xanthomonadaceae bacterium]